MKTLKELLHITEHSGTNEWILSFRKPEFQGGDSEIISEEDAKLIMSMANFGKRLNDISFAIAKCPISIQRRIRKELQTIKAKNMSNSQPL